MLEPPSDHPVPTHSTNFQSFPFQWNQNQNPSFSVLSSEMAELFSQDNIYSEIIIIEFSSWNSRYGCFVLPDGQSATFFQIAQLLFPLLNRFHITLCQDLSVYSLKGKNDFAWKNGEYNAIIPSIITTEQISELYVKEGEDQLRLVSVHERNLELENNEATKLFFEDPVTEIIVDKAEENQKQDIDNLEEGMGNLEVEEEKGSVGEQDEKTEREYVEWFFFTKLNYKDRQEIWKKALSCLTASEIVETKSLLSFLSDYFNLFNGEYFDREVAKNINKLFQSLPQTKQQEIIIEIANKITEYDARTRADLFEIILNFFRRDVEIEVS